jgi:hypothetical protein
VRGRTWAENVITVSRRKIKLSVSQRKFDMWYATLTETRQTIPPSKSDAEQQSDFPVDQAATADSEKACKANVPGSEYWLP